MLDDTTCTYVDMMGNLWQYIRVGNNEDVSLCDGLVSADIDGVELICFFEYYEEE